MEIFFVSFALVCGAVGLLGAVLPALPGPPVSFLGLLLLLLCSGVEVSTTFLVVSGIIMAVITAIDYILPVWFTQLSGGSKESVRGALAGMLLGLLFMPWGIIIGPFVGAFAGEYIACKRSGQAFKVASVSFIAFLVTTALKLIYSVVLLFYMVKVIVW
ncbi:MAG: DUF456 domain-containing protein [Bacteroidaceae bacterium]|nr:DUF456 domain-containing protein [Bacteroidaceae bacterium]